MPLLPRKRARSWRRVNRLLATTLHSVRAQDDRDFRLLLTAHEEPPAWRAVRNDPRFRLIIADWPCDRYGSGDDDAGAKKWRMKEEVLGSGGGLLMYLDADDLVDRRLVATARREIGPDRAGGIIRSGYAIDYVSRRAIALPDGRLFDGDFHRLCGSSTVGRLDAVAEDPLARDPFDALGSHHLWLENAEQAGLDLAMLPLIGGYLINTSENLSELHGRYSDWRRQFSFDVAEQGEPLDRQTTWLLGLEGRDDRVEESAAPSRIAAQFR